MPSNSFPQKLWRPLAEVKNYIEKMPQGVTMTMLSQKVSTFGALNKKDKDTFIECASGRESIKVFKARSKGAKLATTFFIHQKYEIPTHIPGYEEIITGDFSKKGKTQIVSTPSETKPEPEQPTAAQITLPPITAKSETSANVTPPTPTAWPTPSSPASEPVKLNAPGLENLTKGKAQKPSSEPTPRELREKALAFMRRASELETGSVSDLITTQINPQLELSTTGKK